MPLRTLRRSCQDRVLWLASAWLMASGAGFAFLMHYAGTPGRAGTPVACWPAACRVRLDPERANLVLFAHPHCPCTRASIDSLARIMTRCRGRVTTHVVFCKPDGFPVNWEQTDLWSSAAAIPGMTVLRDDGGDLARVFGAETSGHVLLYSREGKRLFSGGITVARGHAGDNAGQEAVIDHLTGRATERNHAAVFGCPLRAPTEPDLQGETP